jgi:hypothetical protein
LSFNYNLIENEPPVNNFIIKNRVYLLT